MERVISRYYPVDLELYLVKSEVVKILVPDRHFYHIHVDLVGPLRYSSGYNYLWTVLNRSTRWSEVILLFTTNFFRLGICLYQYSISRFGVLSMSLLQIEDPSSSPLYGLL